MTDYYTLREAAELFGVEYPALYRAAWQGRVRTRRFGPIRIVTLEDARRYAEGYRRKTRKEKANAEGS